MTTNNSKTYPFETKAQIAEKIATDTNYALACLVELHNRQTQWEQNHKATKDQNRVGFMSSHASVGSKLAEKVRDGVALTDEETAKAVRMIARYTRQLAQFSREAALAANPELAATAKIFGV